ncbi:MAG: hypothetical protein AMK69_20280 [Nitrospira bacterium SG8_3]|nr:MAG: hypothetical protein AMK69_20280 [Nitrospira bacterium SG8_3]
MNALQFEAVKVALKQDKTGFVLTLNIHPDELPEELIRDYVGSRYGVAMVRIEDDETARKYDNRVKQSGILCRSREFQYWLHETGKTETITEEDAVEYIYRACGIRSRSELNGNIAAKEKFDSMVSEYDEWRQDQEPF